MVSGYGFWLWLGAPIVPPQTHATPAPHPRQTRRHHRKLPQHPPAPRYRFRSRFPAMAKLSGHAFRLSLCFPVMLSDYGYDRVNQSCHRKPTQHRHHTPGKHGDTTGTRHNRYIRQPQTPPAHDSRQACRFPARLRLPSPAKPSCPAGEPHPTGKPQTRPRKCIKCIDCNEP